MDVRQVASQSGQFGQQPGRRLEDIGSASIWPVNLCVIACCGCSFVLLQIDLT